MTPECAMTSMENERLVCKMNRKGITHSNGRIEELTHRIADQTYMARVRWDRGQAQSVRVWEDVEGLALQNRTEPKNQVPANKNGPVAGKGKRRLILNGNPPVEVKEPQSLGDFVGEMLDNTGHLAPTGVDHKLREVVYRMASEIDKLKQDKDT